MPGYNRLRLPADYQALSGLDARGFAWEWLRRNADFRSIWHSASPSARRVGASVEAARRSARIIIAMAQHPLARRWSPWGLTFRARSRYSRDRRPSGRLEART